MARETTLQRNEAFSKLERECRRLGITCEEDGAARRVTLPSGIQWRICGGGGSGVLRCEVLNAEGEKDAEVVAPLGRIVGTLERQVTRR